MNPISPSDLDALSALIDGQLPPAERAALEARLAAEPALRAELDELRAVVAALHQLPPLRAPRDLTLTPAQVQPRPARRVALFPAFVSGLSAVAAALLLIAGIGLLRPAVLPSSGTNTAQVAALATAASTATQPEPLILREALPAEAEVTEESADLLSDSAGTTMQESAAGTGAAEGAASLAAPAAAAESQALDSMVLTTPTATDVGTGNAAVSGAAPPLAGTLAPPGAEALQFQFAAPTGGAGGDPLQGGQAQMTLPADEQGTRVKEATPTAQPTASPTPAPTASAQPTSTVPTEPAQPREAAPAGVSPIAGWTLIAGAIVLLGLAVLAGWRARRGA